ncbi:MAG: NRDE family protein [Akkermansiaceae bacterium]
MCTLSWSRPSPDTLEVWFNRDEKKARPIADPPAVRKLSETRFLSPRDPQGGGTWMLANEYGLVVCLLNRWELGGKSASGVRKSRGQLVWRMAVAKTIEEIALLLVDLENHPPFILVGLSTAGEVAWDWDGQELAEIETKQPFTSSSYCFQEVRKFREAAFAGSDPEGYHASAGEEATAFTVRMNRPDAQTWSRSKVVVGEKVEWEYLAEQADLAGDPERFLLTLPL